MESENHAAQEPNSRYVPSVAHLVSETTRMWMRHAMTAEDALQGLAKDLSVSEWQFRSANEECGRLREALKERSDALRRTSTELSNIREVHERVINERNDIEQRLDGLLHERERILRYVNQCISENNAGAGHTFEALKAFLEDEPPKLPTQEEIIAHDTRELRRQAYGEAMVEDVPKVKPFEVPGQRQKAETVEAPVLAKDPEDDPEDEEDPGWDED